MASEHEDLKLKGEDAENVIGGVKHKKEEHKAGTFAPQGLGDSTAPGTGTPAPPDTEVPDSYMDTNP